MAIIKPVNRTELHNASAQQVQRKIEEAPNANPAKASPWDGMNASEMPLFANQAYPYSAAELKEQKLAAKKGTPKHDLKPIPATIVKDPADIAVAEANVDRQKGLGLRSFHVGVNLVNIQSVADTIRRRILGTQNSGIMDKVAATTYKHFFAQLAKECANLEAIAEYNTQSRCDREAYISLEVEKFDTPIDMQERLENAFKRQGTTLEDEIARRTRDKQLTEMLEAFQDPEVQKLV